MAVITTPHISADINAFAPTVLMPGDPMRAKFIAEEFLTDAVLVNNIRGVQGHTGKWKGVPVSVMASGMGIPAISIYSWELYHFFPVQNIIRIGSAGALNMDLNLMDIVAGMGACTDSNISKSVGPLNGSFAPIADFGILSAAVETAKEHSVDMKVGNLLSSDAFYSAPENEVNEAWRNMNVLAVEMEAAGLYTMAAYARKKALCICTISDHIYKHDKLSPQERETALTDMIQIGLDTAIKLP